MKKDIVIPKELLAQYDLMNTINGGMSEMLVRAWQEKDGYSLEVIAPGVDFEKVHIEAVEQRFVIYYTLDVLEGAEKAPVYLVNLPLLPNVDVDRISAYTEKNTMHVFAPFNDWARGTRKEIDFDS